MLRGMKFAAVAAAACWIAGCEPGANTPESGSVDATSTAPLDEADAPIPESDDDTSTNGSAQAEDSDVWLQVANVDDFRSLLEQHRGDVVLVDYWATWCIPCRADFPHTVEMSRKYADDGLTIISVSMDDPDESRQAALDFLKEQNAQFPNLISSLGSSPQSLEQFDVDGGVPHYKVFGRDGEVFREFVNDVDSSFDHDDIEAAVREALGLDAAS